MLTNFDMLQLGSVSLFLEVMQSTGNGKVGRRCRLSSKIRLYDI